MTAQAVSQGRKFAQVVRGAVAIFLRDGYAGASVDDIARAAQVSKATLYSYFPDKKLMFQEAMRAEIARMEGSFALDIPADMPPDQAVPLIASRIAKWLVDPVRLGLYRIHTAEAPRFGRLSASFHDNLTRIPRDFVRAHLDRWVASGLLSIDDTDDAARLLVSLSATGLHDAVLLDRSQAATEAAICRTAMRAADAFLRGCTLSGQAGRRRIATG